MDKTEIVKELNETISEFQNLLSYFNEEQLNAVLVQGRWTPGQVAQHIIMANSGFVDVLNGPTKKTNRPAGEWVERIKSDFLNFNIKMTSPDFIDPILKVYNKAHLLTKLETIKGNLCDAIMAHDLEPTCTSFELPVYGGLTRLEAVYFVIYHTMRHIEQLKKIKENYTSN